MFYISADELARMVDRLNNLMESDDTEVAIHAQETYLDLVRKAQNWIDIEDVKFLNAYFILGDKDKTEVIILRESAHGTDFDCESLLKVDSYPDAENILLDFVGNCVDQMIDSGIY